jgi:hypothetical protein
MAAIANVQLSDTFNTWRVRSNAGFTRLNQFAINESSLFANTVTANVKLQVTGANADFGTSNVFFANTSQIRIGGSVGNTGQVLALSSNRTLVFKNSTASFDGLTGTIAGSQIPDHFKTDSNTIFSGAKFQANNWSIVRANFNVEPGRNYFANTGGTGTGFAGASIVATLPSAAAIGDRFRVVIAGDANTNPFTVSRNGHRIQGELANLQVTTINAGFGLVYMSANAGWRLEEV